MVSALISRVVILVFGTLYPAYSSYKAVKTKNVKEYVKWMMYWIVFALFTTVETFADVLVSWFPFYYELKIVFVIWLLSPATKGSSVLYRKFVHPELLKREEEIDTTIDKVKSQGYSALVNVGQQGLNLAVQGAVTGQNKMMDHLMKKSFSMGDISRQQTNNEPVTYRPSTERIAEGDEPDFSRYHAAPGTVGSQVETQSLQGGEEKRDPEKLLTEFDQHNTGTQGYNLRSHEYHGENPAKQRYHHSEAENFTTCSSNGINVDEPVLPVDSAIDAVQDNIINETPTLTFHKPRPPKGPVRRTRSRSAGRKLAERKINKNIRLNKS